MNRPYTICYLNLSAEGHIDGEFMKSPAAAQTTEVFRQRWLEMGADAILYGAVTMAMFAQGRLKEPLPEKGPFAPAGLQSALQYGPLLYRHGPQGEHRL